MQVAAHIVQRCPFLLESDQLELAPSLAFDLRRHMLLDNIGIEHRLSPPGGCVISALADGCNVGQVRQLAAEHGMADLQLSELLGFLNSIGGLLRRRSPRRRPAAWLIQLKHSLLSVHYGRLTWRQEATAGTVLWGVVRASTPVIVLAGLVGLLMTGGELLSPLRAAGFACFGTSLFLASLFVHELGHVRIARRKGVPVAVLQSGMRLGIIHRQLTPRAEVCSALAGPAAGLFVAVLTAGAVGWHAPAYGWLGLAIGLFHLGGFLPWYGDSVSLRRALRRRHENAA